jgi:glycosyltransferase involved in cell wall biosynthesis
VSKTISDSSTCTTPSLEAGGVRIEPTKVLRVLVLDEELPFPPDAGKRIRTWNLLRRLAQRHEISFLCYGQATHPSARALQDAGIRVHLVPPPPAFLDSKPYLRLFANLFSSYPYSVDKHFSTPFQTKMEKLLATENFDLVHCEWTPYARFRHAVKKLPFVIASHNVESQIWFRRAEQNRGLIPRLFFRLQALKMKRFERRALIDAQMVTAVTPDDAQVMRSWGVRNLSLVENGVDLEYFQPSPETPGGPELLFLASLDWFPNLDSLDYLLEQIMPLVLAERPQTRLRIVGRRPSEALKTRVNNLDWAELVADVADVRPYFAQSAVVAVPLRIGGGSRIKILESLAAGKAVVSTSVGAEGLALVGGKHLEIADQADVFARKLLDLLARPQERQRLGDRGREAVVEKYSWDKIAREMESAWLDACRVWKHNTSTGSSSSASEGILP